MPYLSSALISQTTQSYLHYLFFLTEDTVYQTHLFLQAWTTQLDYISQPPLPLGVPTYMTSGQWDVSGRDEPLLVSYTPTSYTLPGTDLMGRDFLEQNVANEFIQVAIDLELEVFLFD